MGERLAAEVQHLGATTSSKELAVRDRRVRGLVEGGQVFVSFRERLLGRHLCLQQHDCARQKSRAKQIQLRVIKKTNVNPQSNVSYSLGLAPSQLYFVTPRSHYRVRKGCF